MTTDNTNTVIDGLGSIFNPEQPGKRIVLLAKRAANSINSLKSTDMFTAADILKQSNDKATRLSKSTRMTKKPAIA